MWRCLCHVDADGSQNLRAMWRRAMWQWRKTRPIVWLAISAINPAGAGALYTRLSSLTSCQLMIWRRPASEHQLTQCEVHMDNIQKCFAKIFMCVYSWAFKNGDEGLAQELIYAHLGLWLTNSKWHLFYVTNNAMHVFHYFSQDPFAINVSIGSRNEYITCVSTSITDALSCYDVCICFCESLKLQKE